MKPLVIYHRACRDGFCAAWVFADALGVDNVDFHAANYGEEPPPVAGRDVYVVDFSWPRDVMDRMYGEATFLLVLDHHKTAEAALAGAPYAVFDMDRSGAGMAWDELHPSEPRPWIVDYVEDRDLWRYKHPQSALVNAWIACLEFDFSVWALAAAGTVEDAAKRGEVAIMRQRNYVAEVSKNARRVSFEGHADVPCVNAPQFDISELVGELAKEAPLAIGWWQRADGVFQYSLRSRGDDGVDVSELARRYGGGGHKNAAGFQLDRLVF